MSLSEVPRPAAETLLWKNVVNGRVSYHLQILFDDGIYRCIKGMLNMGHFLSFGHSQEPEYNRGQLSVALQESTSVLPEKESVLCSTKV